MLRVAVLLTVVLCACAPAREQQPDDFFTMPLDPLQAVSEESHVLFDDDVQGYHVDLRWTAGGEVVQSPSMILHAGQWGSLHVGDQVSFVQDFDIEVAGDAFVADPIIGILQTGYAVTLRVEPATDAERVVLTLTAVRSELDTPIPTRNLRISEEGSPVTIQLPAMRIGSLACVKHLKLGIESVLTRLPGPNGPEQIAVRVDSVRLAKPESLPDSADDEPIDSGATPLGTGSLRIRLLRMVSLDSGRHLERSAVEPALRGGGAETIREFLLPGGAQPGTRVATLLQRSYVSAMPPKGRMRDPEIDTLRVGFRARIERGGDRAVLRYEWSSLRGVTVTESGDTHKVTRRRGEVALRGDATLQPVARNADGGVLAILFERLD